MNCNSQKALLWTNVSILTGSLSVLCHSSSVANNETCLVSPTYPKEGTFEWAVYYSLILRACIHMVIPVRSREETYKVVDLYAINLISSVRVGKSEGLSIQRYTCSFSKVELQFISLSPLEQHSIQEHLEKSPTLPPDRHYVSEVLCNENFSTAELAESLLEYTVSVPGLMT
eukprot:jgi/Galph1/1904/GphlegSOOS_G572.1